MDRWTGRVALVTGASSGIGASIAEELVKKGLKVVGLARRVDRMKELSTKLKLASGALFPVKCDITKEEELTKAFNWVTSNLGGVDILINNAGAFPNNSLIEGPEEDWRNIIEVNVYALSVCTKMALKSMKERGIDDGHIVNINSIAGHYMLDHLLMYTASKHAVTVLTEGLRRELVKNGSKIRVTSISPGLVKTETTPQRFLGIMPTLETKDIADAVLFALQVPSHVQIQEIIIRPVGETF